jgi:hypothetical protein
VTRFGSRGRRASPRHPGRVLVDGFTASLCTTFVSALIAGPTISSLAFYLQLGCVIGVLSRMTIESRLKLESRQRSTQLGFAVAGNAQSSGTNDAGQPEAKDRGHNRYEMGAAGGPVNDGH